MTEIRLPQFGMGMSDGTIIAWSKSEGDYIAKGEPLCEIEAAKTTVEMEAPESGVLQRILVKVDENVPVNTVICEIVAAVAETQAEPQSADLDVAAGQANVAEETKQAPPPRASPLARREAAQRGVDLASLKGSGPNGRIVRADIDAAPRVVSEVQVEPRARRLARDSSIDLATLIGSGPGGRIIAEDVESALAQASKVPAAVTSPVAETKATPPAHQARATAGEATPPSAPAPVSGGPAVEVPHNMMRRTIARRLTESKQTVPHFYVKASCRIDALLAMRKELNNGPVKLSVNDLIVRAVALALIEVPDANVAWTEKAMLRSSSVDVAVAVATPRGLVTPIIRAVETKPIRQISSEIKDLAERAKAGKLSPHEYQGGNTTVSNLGMFGVEEFSAILNPPQASIFAIGAGEQRIVPLDGKAEVATMMTVTISVDHRAIDGSVAAMLLASFKRLIEAPACILI